MESWKIWYFGEKNLKFGNNFEIRKLIWKFGKKNRNLEKDLEICGNLRKNGNLKKKLEIIRKYGKI